MAELWSRVCDAHFLFFPASRRLSVHILSACSFFKKCLFLLLLLLLLMIFSFSHSSIHSVPSLMRHECRMKKDSSTRVCYVVIMTLVKSFFRKLMHTKTDRSKGSSAKRQLQHQRQQTKHTMRYSVMSKTPQKLPKESWENGCKMGATMECVWALVSGAGVATIF